MNKTENYHSSTLDDIFEDITPAESEKVEKRMLLSARILDAIKAKGWRKIDFAKALNKQPSEITKWLSGTHNFNSDTLFDIERVLDIDLFTISREGNVHEQVITFNISVSQDKAVPTVPQSTDSWDSSNFSDHILSTISLMAMTSNSITNSESLA